MSRMSSRRSAELPPTPPGVRNGRRLDVPPRSASYPSQQAMPIPPPASAGQRPLPSPSPSSASSPGFLSDGHAYDYYHPAGESSRIPHPSRDWRASQFQEGCTSFNPYGTYHRVPPAFSQPESRSAAQLMPPPAAPLPQHRGGPDPIASPAKTEHTLRPPNAWILYRSDKLRAIAAGESVPGLEDVSTSTSASSGDETKKSESQTPDTSSHPTSPPKAKKPVRARKGVKPPTEGLLALGRGKLGRGLPQADISKLISTLWRGEKPEVRAKYERLSDQKKMEHQRKFPNYKFQPLRKADKIKMREEKEQERLATKQERDIRRAAGRGSGRAVRNRMRASPASPYANPPADVHRNHQAPQTARALRFSGDEEDRKAIADGVAAGTTVFWASEGNAYPPPRPLTPAPRMSYESAFTFAQPEPPASEASFTYRMDPFPFPAAATPALVTGSPRSAPRAEAGYLVIPPCASSSGELPQDPSSESPAAFGYSGRSWDSYNQALAIPYLFEPIPLPDDLVLEDSVQFEQPIDSNSLAAMWCTLEEAPGDPPLSNWDVDSGDAVNQWSDLTIPPDEFEPKSFELSSTLASRIASQWAHDQEGSHNRRGASNYASARYLSLRVDEPSESEREGPSLSEAIPLSPSDWLSPDTPGAAMADSGDSNRRVSGTNSYFDGGPTATASELGLQPSTSLPSNLSYRHVSNSAYPQYPLSEDSGHGFSSSELPGWSLPMSSRVSSLNGIPPPLSFGKANEEDALDDWKEEQEPQGLTPPLPVSKPGARRRGRAVGSSFGSGTK